MKLAIIFTIIITAKICYSLICQNCLEDCKILETEECLEPGEFQQIACLRQTSKGVHNNETYEQRKCVIYLKEIEDFECVSEPGYKVTSCKICHTDLCNNEKEIYNTTTKL